MGPDLIGISQKRERSWLLRWIAAPDQLLAEEDPIALQLFQAYGEKPMPNFGLSENDVTAVLEYIDSESEKRLASTLATEPQP